MQHQQAFCLAVGRTFLESQRAHGFPAGMVAVATDSSGARSPFDRERCSDRRSAMARRVLVVGGGVAALELVLALRKLAGDDVAMQVVTPEREFVYRPLAVAEPFGFG